MNLIKKYQPKMLESFILNADFKELLYTLIDIGSTNILLNGDNSSGKTTLINIIINEYYKNEFCDNEIKHRIINNNIYKINSLNEQGVNVFRQYIKSFCQTMSIIPNKKKIVIIDDIDNLNKNNQQILRNCIDKYSNKVNFICSCSNMQNVLDNIQSRLLIFNIPKLVYNQINSLFTSIIENENISIDSECLECLFKISNYNINIIFNNLQKLILSNCKINTSLVMKICTNFNYQVFDSFLDALHNNDIISSTQILNSLYNNGFSINDILEAFFDYVKFTDKICDKKKFILFKVIGKYITNFYVIHDEKIELFLFTQELKLIL
jgi:DNA polymerase III delta prime subunit